MQSGQAGAMACRPSSSCALLLHRAPPGLSLVASPSARFISILSSPRSRTPLTVLAIHAQDPDFYKIPYVEGIPVGKRLKLWNLPPNCKHSELLEWFAGIDVKVDSLEFTDDPVLNAQGIGGFVEFATKQHACIAIVRLDGYKFRGHYIRMDFAEKRPHSRDYGSRRNRPNWSSSSSSRGSFATSSRPPVTDMVPSYGGAYEAANSSAVQASSGYGSSTQSTNTQWNPRHEAANSCAVQASSDYGSSAQSSDFYRNSAGNSEGIQSNPSYGNAQSPLGYGSTSPSSGYGATQFTPGHGSAPSSSVSEGSLSVSSDSPPPNTQSAPSYGFTPENGQSAPSYGNTSVSGGTQPSSIQHIPSYGNSHSSHGSSQQAPSYDDTELNGQSAAVPSTLSYNNRSRASPYGNSSMQPLYSDGTVTGKSFKSGSGWAGNNSPQGTANYGVDKFPTASYSSQSPTSSYSSQPSSSTSDSNNQSDSAFGKSIPWTHGNSSPQLASSMGKSTIQSGSSYGSIKDTAYGNTISPSYGDSKPPSVTQSSPSYGSVDSQSVSSYGNTGMQSSTISTQSSFGSSQIPSGTKSSPGSVSIPPQSSYGEVQPSATSFTTQATPSAYDGTKKSPIGTVSNNGRASLHSPVAQGRSPSSSYAKVEPYEDLFKNYGAPDAAVVEPWLKNTSFKSGPMFGSPQPSSLNRLFVGNLAVSIDDATLQELFSKFGTVLESRVLRDQESGRSRGFAVVAMSSVDEVRAASKALDGWRVESRPLKVDAVTSMH